MSWFSILENKLKWVDYLVKKNRSAIIIIILDFDFKFIRRLSENHVYPFKKICKANQMIYTGT